MARMSLSNPQSGPASVTPVVEPARPASRQLGERVRNLRLSRLPERRTPWGKIIGWPVALLVVSVGGWWGYSQIVGSAGTGEEAEAGRAEPGAETRGQKTEDRGQQSSNPQSAIRSPQLTAAAAAPGEIALEAKGYIVPRQQILVSPKVSGMILTLDVEEGRRVKKGDVLAVLESTEYEAEAEKANATVALMEQRLLELKNGSRPEEIRQAEAELEEARAELVQLEADWRRSAELRKRNSVTEQEYELAESKYLAQRQTIKRLEAALELWKIGTRKEKLDAAAAEVDQAKAELTKAQWRLGNCTIRSPISGTILKKNAEEGNIVNPIAFNGSFSICELADLADLEVDLNVSERDISAVKVGQKCRIRTDAWPDRVYDGVVSRLMPIADRAKAAVPVRVKIAIPADEQGQYLKPEMGAIVTFLNDKP
jgi:multidrug resistance efflux pump